MLVNFQLYSVEEIDKVVAVAGGSASKKNIKCATDSIITTNGSWQLAASDSDRLYQSSSTAMR